MQIAHDPDLHEHLLVKTAGGRIVEATIKAIVDTTEGVRLHGPASADPLLSN